MNCLQAHSLQLTLTWTHLCLLEWEGNVFRGVCLSVGGWGGGNIKYTWYRLLGTYRTQYQTWERPHWTVDLGTYPPPSLSPRTLDLPPDIRPGKLPPVSDIWWRSLETCLNFFIPLPQHQNWGPTSPSIRPGNPLPPDSRPGDLPPPLAPPPDIRPPPWHQTWEITPASDIWWRSLETCSNVFI